MSNAQNKSTMTFNTISTSDYGTFKTGSYTLNGQPYRVNGNCVGGQWSWTLAHDMSNHNNLREVKSHLLTLVGQDTQELTQKDTIRRACELLDSGLRVYNHDDCTNDLTERRVGGQICSNLTHVRKVYVDMYKVFRFGKVVGTYKTAMGATRKLAEMNKRCTAFFAMNPYTERYTFLTEYPVFKD